MKWLTRERVVPIISASVSWLIFAITGSGQTALAKEIAGFQKCDHGFLALLGDDGLLDLAALDVENGIRGIALPEHDLILPIIGNGSSAIYLGEKHLGIERQLCFAFHSRPSKPRLYTSLGCVVDYEWHGALGRK